MYQGLDPTPAATDPIRSSLERHDRRHALWETLSVSLGTLLVVGAGIVGVWATSTHSIRENYQHYLIGLAQTAATQIDPQLHNSIRHPEQRNDPDYRRAVAPLRKMKRAVADVHYIFTVIRDGSKIRFVLDSGDPAGENGSVVDDQANVLEVYDGPHPALWQALGRDGVPGRPAANAEPVQDKWGWFMTAAAPLLAPDGHQIGAVGVDVDASVYMARLATARNWALAGLLPAGILIALLGSGFYRIRMRSFAHARAAIQNAETAERAAATLAEERRRLAAVIEGTEVGIWEWDMELQLCVVDQRWAGMIGRSAADLSPLSGRAWQELVHPEDQPQLEQAIKRCMTTPDPVLAQEFRMRHTDGRWVWVLARGRVMERDSQGRPRRMAGIHLDVSAQRAVEQSLKESESKFRSLFELSPVGIALNDRHTGQFLQINDALVAPTGYTRDELLGLTYWDITPQTYSFEETSQIEAMNKTGRYGPYEKEYRRRDGSTYPVLLSGICMTDALGREVIWSIVQDISQRKAMEIALAEAARSDKLTGLANRALFMERLQRAVERVRAGKQRLFAVLFLDFDRFKLINDTLGHKAGDEMLCQIAQRMRRTLRAEDANGPDLGGNLVARFGGDEFLVLINDLTTRADADTIAGRLLNALCVPYDIFGAELRTTASIGIVTSDETHTSAEDVLRNADVAMYEAKRSGRGRFMIFDEAMHARIARNVMIETGLEKAVDNNELSLVYQPIIELESGRMVSAEALVRWNHPELGPISPCEFIPIAEEMGAIAALGRWVLKEACQAFASWRRADELRAPRTISVNISRAELALGGRMLDQLLATLKETDLTPSCLQLEVTEREVMENPAASLGLMRELRNLGVSLAMDDFGTGTSSLRFLRDYPFSTIKIDRSFIKDLNTGADVLAVMHATIRLVENLGMLSVAEGVEEPAQLAILQSLGCRYAQGFLFSRPVPADQLLGAAGSGIDTRFYAAAG